LKKIKKEADITTRPIWKAVIWVLFGTIGLTVGSKWVVDSSTNIASLLQISEGFIGLTLIAVGTSLPEITTSVIAAFRKRSDIAVGNLIGSSIFNIGWVLGITAVAKPLKILPSMIHDMYWIVGSTVILFLFLLVSKPRHSLKRWQGVLLLLLYAIFLYFLYVGQLR
jgi:cation:H+ antiporter